MLKFTTHYTINAMITIKLTDEQLRFLHIMVDDYTPTDEDEEELKDSIAEKLPFIYND